MNLVFEFCETDLESILMEQSVVLKPEHIKCHMKMMLEGINFLHKNYVLHRVSARGVVEIVPQCMNFIVSLGERCCFYTWPHIPVDVRRSLQ